MTYTPKEKKKNTKKRNSERKYRRPEHIAKHRNVMPSQAEKSVW